MVLQAPSLSFDHHLHRSTTLRVGHAFSRSWRHPTRRPLCISGSVVCAARTASARQGRLDHVNACVQGPQITRARATRAACLHARREADVSSVSSPSEEEEDVDVGLLGVAGLTSPEAFLTLTEDILKRCKGEMQGISAMDGDKLTATAFSIEQQVYSLLPVCFFCKENHHNPAWRQAGATAHTLLKSFLEDCLRQILSQAQLLDLQEVAEAGPSLSGQGGELGVIQQGDVAEDEFDWLNMGAWGADEEEEDNVPKSGTAQRFASQQQLQEDERSCLEALEHLLEGPVGAPVIEVPVSVLLRNPLLRDMADEVMDEEFQSQLSSHPRALTLPSGQTVPLVNPSPNGLPSPGHVLLPLDSTLLQQLLTAESSEGLRKLAYEAGLEQHSRSVFKVLDELADLRHRQAMLDSQPSHSHATLKDSAIGSPEASVQFLHDLLCASRPMADAEVQLYSAYQEGEREGELLPWNVKYVNRQVFEEAGVIPDWPGFEPYFSLEGCLEGAGRLLSQVLGIGLRPVGMSPCESWLESGVSKLEVWDEVEAKCLGEVYMEFDVEFKQGHAATTSLVRYGSTASRSALPAVALYFPLALKPRWGTYLTRPAFLRTLLHELGHAIHYLLSPSSPNVRASAVYCPTDLAEIPSHVLEKYVEEPQALQLMLSHAVTGEPMPKDMCEVLGQYFCVGCTALQLQEQALVGLFDLLIHGVRSQQIAPASDDSKHQVAAQLSGAEKVGFEIEGDEGGYSVKKAKEGHNSVKVGVELSTAQARAGIDRALVEINNHTEKTCVRHSEGVSNSEHQNLVNGAPDTFMEHTQNGHDGLFSVPLRASAEEVWWHLRKHHSSLPHVLMTWPAYQTLRDKSTTHAGTLYAYDFARYVSAHIWCKCLRNGVLGLHSLRTLLWDQVLCVGASMAPSAVIRLLFADEPSTTYDEKRRGSGSASKDGVSLHEHKQYVLCVHKEVVRHMVAFDST